MDNNLVRGKDVGSILQRYLMIEQGFNSIDFEATLSHLIDDSVLLIQALFFPLYPEL